MEADVSNKTIVVLVVLTVIISILSTLVVLNEVNGISVNSAGNSVRAQQPVSANNKGYVSLNIVEPQPEAVKTTGQVMLEIK